MNKDEYGEIINGEDTYKGIAMHLNHGGKALIGWTDRHGTHFDILFIKGVEFQGSNIQGGIRESDLFVSIMRIGSFSFEIDNSNTHWGYYEEKLGSGMSFGSVTGQELADLINGVKKLLC